jgi:hypothetical protein
LIISIHIYCCCCCCCCCIWHSSIVEIRIELFKYCSSKNMEIDNQEKKEYRLMLFVQNSSYPSMCLTHWHARKKWRIEVRERVMVVVKQRRPNAFFSFSFS